MKESLCFLRTHFIIHCSHDSTACFDGTDTAVDEWQSLWPSSSTLLYHQRRG